MTAAPGNHRRLLGGRSASPGERVLPPTGGPGGRLDWIRELSEG